MKENLDLLAKPEPISFQIKAMFLWYLSKYNDICFEAGFGSCIFDKYIKVIFDNQSVQH